MATFTSNTSGAGSWMAPLGVTAVTVEIWGGGGGGGTANNTTSAGGGGGGGAYTRLNATVVAGTTYDYDIGAGGAAAAANNSNGTAGGNSDWNNNQITAPGGAAGLRGRNVANAAGGANNNTNADASFHGGAGANKATSAGGGGGGCAGANANGTAATSVTGAAGGGTGGGASNGANATLSGGGAGGAGGSSNNSGHVAGNPGGGGGGGGGNNSGVKTGGAGANGQILLTWTPPTPTTGPDAECGLSAGGDPGVSTGHSINIRGRVQTTTASATFRALLFQGATQITTTFVESATLTTTITTYSLALLSTDVANITDYTQLRVEFWAYSVDGETPVVEVEDIWLQAPAAPLLLSGQLLHRVPGSGRMAAVSRGRF